MNRSTSRCNPISSPVLARVALGMVGWAGFAIIAAPVAHAQAEQAQADPTHGFSLEVDHSGPIVLGVSPANLPVTLTVPASQDDANRQWHLTTNVGAFGDLEPSGPNQYSTTYQLPETRYPQVALVGIWREADSNTNIPIHRIALSGRTSITVRARRGSSVVAVVDDKEFGPVEVDRGRSATVPIEVPPGVDEVVVTISRKKRRRRQSVDVNVPAYNRLILVALPDRLIPDGETAVNLVAYFDAPSGSPQPDLKDIKVKAPRGALTHIKTVGKRYHFRFVPEKHPPKSFLELTAWLRKKPVHKAKTLLAVRAGEPASLSIVQQPQALVADGKSETTLTVRIADKYDLLVPEQTLETEIDHGVVVHTRELEAGIHEVQIRAPEHYPKSGEVQLSVFLPTQAGAPLRASVTIPAGVPPWPLTLSLRVETYDAIADGVSPITVRAKATDASGAQFNGEGLLVVANGGESVVLQSDGSGEYHGELLPADGSTTLTLTGRSQHGFVGDSYQVTLRPPPPKVTVGAAFVVSYDGAWSPGISAEGSYRPRRWGHRYSGVFTAEYRRTSLGIRAPQLREVGSEISMHTTWQHLGMSAGARALVWGLPPEMNVQVGGAACLSAYSVSVHPEGYASTTQRGLAPGIEMMVGFEHMDMFAHFTLRAMRIRGSDLRGPGMTSTLGAGYRWGAL